jgi:hypothetical protein
MTFNQRLRPTDPSGDGLEGIFEPVLDSDHVSQVINFALLASLATAYPWYIGGSQHNAKLPSPKFWSPFAWMGNLLIPTISQQIATG